jgi:Ca2+-binding RTX toxin-like protein
MGIAIATYDTSSSATYPGYGMFSTNSNFLNDNRGNIYTDWTVGNFDVGNLPNVGFNSPNPANLQLFNGVSYGISHKTTDISSFPFEVIVTARNFDGFGGNGNDHFKVTAAGTVNILARGGNDLIEVCGTGSSTVYGGTGDDTIHTSSGNDTLYGDDGNDVLDGGAGIDTMVGGIGNDTYYVDNLGDTITEIANQGTDSVHSTLFSYVLADNVENLSIDAGGKNGIGNTLSNTITGNSGDNVVAGLGGNDTLYGNDGNDVLNGGTGDDTMVGGQGNDLYIVDSDLDVITELDGGGTDTVQTSLTSYTLSANLERLTLTATEGETFGSGNEKDNILIGNAADDLLFAAGGADIIDSGAGNDTLDGGTENDALNGRAGNDSLIGGLGNDNLTGGSGADVFYFVKGDQKDYINDFSHEDHIAFYRGSSADTFAEVMSYAKDVGANTLIDFKDGDTITIKGMHVADFVASDFLFPAF